MRRRILLLVVGMTVLVVLAFAIPLAVLIRNNAYDDATTALTRRGSDLALFLRGYDTTRTSAQILAAVQNSGDDRVASVELPSGQVIGTLPPGGAGALPASNVGRGGGSDGNGGGGPFGGAPGGGDQPMAIDYHGGRLVQLPVLAFGQAGAYTVRIYERNASLHSGENDQLLILGGASVGLILLGVLLGELLTRRIVRPLLNTSQTAGRLAAGDVTARATTSGPREIADVGLALNRLADRIDQLIADERETLADLSHRLRTPLTALRLDAEALRDPVDAERVGAHVSALERMLTNVIHAARRPQREGRLPSCDATEVVGERVAFWSALAEDQGRTNTLQLPAHSLPVRAGAEDLGAAVDALLENVIAHTPEGTSFGVRLGSDGSVDSVARLDVYDSGPGFTDIEPVRGRSDRGSSGLGLDIARRCAESSGGSMTLGRSESGGALITLVLAAP